VKGEKKEEFKQNDERFYRVERSHGMFSRSLRLPALVDGAKVNAIFKNGLLTVTVPKAPEARASNIPIKIG
jgi:HSP20 family protein